MPEEDRATDVGNMHKIFVQIARVVPDRQTDTHTHTDILITILRNRSCARSNYDKLLRTFVNRYRNQRFIGLFK